MADSSNRKTPPFGQKRVRGQSHDDRDASGFAARKEREAAMANKEFGAEEITGNYQGSELEEQRARRPTPERIKRLELKHDELKGDLQEVRADVKELSGHVSDLREDVSGAVGKLDGQQPVLKELLSIVKKSSERDHIKFTAQVDVDRAEDLAKIEVSKETALDKIDKRRARRKAVLKVMGLLASGGSIIELLHRLGVL